MSDIDFFISYTGADKNWAEWIAWQLEDEDYTCKIQAWDFRPGGDFMQQMRSAMREARQTIAVLSPAYLESRYANAELNAALARDPDGKRGELLPVMVVSFDPPDMLRSRVYIDLAGRDEQQARRELLEGVRASRATRVKPAEAVRFPVRPSFPTAAGSTGAAPPPTTRRTGRPHERLRILFLAAAAGIPLDLEKEFRLISARVVESKHAASISLESRFDVGTEDFLPALNQLRPHVLHFSGNMETDAILLHSENGVRSVSVSALVGLLRTVKDDMRLVVLNACYSLDCAKRLADVVGCGIGIQGEISDAAAIEFAADFYGALASGRSVKNAFDQASAALAFKGVDPGDAPQLVCREGLDAAELLLVPPD